MYYISSHNAKNVLKQAEFFYNKLKSIETINKNTKKIDEESLSILLLLAYPDRLAKQRGKNDNKYKLNNGKGAILNIEDSLFNEDFLVIANLNAQTKDSYINQALKISLQTIEKEFESYIQKKESITYWSGNINSYSELKDSEIK
jgi:ATP-dependent helicase HrpB